MVEVTFWFRPPRRLAATLGPALAHRKSRPRGLMLAKPVYALTRIGDRIGVRPVG